MKSRRLQELLDKLNARVPRGPRGSAQNQFRFAVWFHGSHEGGPFDDTLAQALLTVRQDDPGFNPTILPGA